MNLCANAPPRHASSTYIVTCAHGLNDKQHPLRSSVGPHVTVHRRRRQETHLLKLGGAKLYLPRAPDLLLQFLWFFYTRLIG